MLIEAGLSTYEKECAKRGDDIGENCTSGIRETMERAAVLNRPHRRLDALNQAATINRGGEE